MSIKLFEDAYSILILSQSDSISDSISILQELEISVNGFEDHV